MDQKTFVWKKTSLADFSDELIYFWVQEIMNTLKDLITKIEFSSNWAIYANDIHPDSPARIGNTQFRSGGMLDGKKFIIDGEQVHRAMSAYCDYDLDWFEEHSSPTEFILWMIEEGWLV